MTLLRSALPRSYKASALSRCGVVVQAVGQLSGSVVDGGGLVVVPGVAYSVGEGSGRGGGSRGGG